MQMVNDDPSTKPEVERDRLDVALDYYLIALSVLMMLLGLREWAVILGIFSGAAGIVRGDGPRRGRSPPCICR